MAEKKHNKFLSFRPQPTTVYNDPSHLVSYNFESNKGKGSGFSYIRKPPTAQHLEESVIPEIKATLPGREDQKWVSLVGVSPLVQRPDYTRPIWQAPKSDAPIFLKSFQKSFKPGRSTFENTYDDQDDDNYDYKSKGQLYYDGEDDDKVYYYKRK